MIYDRKFLKELDKCRNKIIFAKITALTFQETPIETIEGRVTGGSINVDGTSALRRTCSLTIVADSFDYNNYVWGLNTKFKLKIGVQNFVDSRYPDIIWFEQGIYLITSFNTSRSTNNFSISIQGKDKMCLLNGEIGGTLESTIDFGCIEEESEDGIWTIRKLPVQEIIRNSVHTYAGEPYHNIIINDLDDYGLELLEYRYDVPVYLYREINSPIFTNVILDGSKKCIVDGVETTLDELTPNQLDLLVDTLTGTSSPAVVLMDGIEWHVAKVEYGQTAGYRSTDLTYAGDLIANIGESLTSVLDKIKNMLVEFEYFYNLQGQFVFQKKQSFINTLWTPLETNIDGEIYSENTELVESYSYIFNEGELITAFNNNPNLVNLRNDFSIWGERTGISGAAIPVHMRYAIDTKPQYYTSFDGVVYTTRTEEEVKKDQEEFNFSIPDNGYKKEPSRFGLSEDWWEVRDWAKAWEFSGLEIPTESLGTYCSIRAAIVAEGGVPPANTGESREISYVSKEALEQWGNFPSNGYFQDDLIFHGDGTYWGTHGGCVHSYTEWLSYFTEGGQYEGGYAYFYKPQVPKDMVNNGQELILGTNIKYKCDWRELIYQMAKDYYQHNTEDDFELKLKENNFNFYPTGQTGYEKYYIDIQGFWRQLYNPYLQEEINKIIDKIKDKDQSISQTKDKKEIERLKQEKEQLEIQKEELIKDRDENYYYDENSQYRFWNRNVYENPEQLNFWFDFLDAEGELQQFNVKNIGSRPKAINENTIKSIYFRKTPDIIFRKSEEKNTIVGYKYIQVDDIESMFSISAQGKSAKNRLDELLYAHGYCVESATITALPIYYLEPNTRIHLQDSQTKLNGDYIVSRISIPLTYNGTMSITATKAAESFV